MYLLTKINYILLFIHTKAVNPTPVNMRNCQISLSMHVKILQKKCGPQIWLCLIIFQPIALKQLNSSTAINTFSCLGGLEVTHQTAVPEVPGSIPCSGKEFYD